MPADPSEGGGCGRDGRIHAIYDWASTAPSTAVAELVAIALDQDVMACEPLHTYVDTVALDDMFLTESAATSDITVSFDVEDHRVTVHSSGDVVVLPQ